MHTQPCGQALGQQANGSPRDSADAFHQLTQRKINDERQNRRYDECSAQQPNQSDPGKSKPEEQRYNNNRQVKTVIPNRS